jgi:hypothetical protein
VLTKTGAPRLVCAKDIGVVRRSAGPFGAVRVVAVQTCALDRQRCARRFSRFECKSEEKKIISRRHSARAGARALLRTERRKLYDVQDGDVVHTPPSNFNSVRVRTTPPWRDVHRGVVARFFYHFQSRFLW